MGDTPRDLGHRFVRTPHKSQANPAHSSRRPQTQPGDPPAISVAAMAPSETADSDRKPENACSRAHSYSFTLDRKVPYGNLSPTRSLIVPSFLCGLPFELVGRDDDARRRSVITNKLHVHGMRGAAEKFFPFPRTIGQVSSRNRSMRFASSSCG
jgi:hypothetical protein